MAGVNTALQIKLSLCETGTCKGFDITSTTGVYDVSTNPTGYDGPNPLLQDIDVSTIAFIFPDGSVHSVDLLAVSNGTFPNTTDTSFTITNTMLGLNIVDKLEDGLYTALYHETGDSISDSLINWDSSITEYFFLTCRTQCCIDKLFGSAQPDDCACDNSSILKRALDAQMWLDAARAASFCGKSSMAIKLLLKAQFLCNTNSCISC